MIKFSVLMPTYNGADVITDALKSVLSQNYKNMELIIFDDCSTDGTLDKVAAFDDDRMRVHSQDKNKGYPENLKDCASAATGDIVFLFAQDDFLAPGYLNHLAKIYTDSEEVLATTREYFWFEKNVSNVLRAKKPFSGKDPEFGEPDRVQLISADSSHDAIVACVDTLDQLSALSFRRDRFVSQAVNKNVFPAHIVPFLHCIRDGHVAVTGGMPLAVRIESSQSIHVSSIYDVSPMQSWVQAIEEVFNRPENKKINLALKQQLIGTNYVGLAQIRAYSRSPFLFTIREIHELVRVKLFNLLNPNFYVFSLGALLLPRTLLVKLVRAYKYKFLKRQNKRIKLTPYD